MDKEFRKWYDARLGTKSKGFAYDVWKAAWEAATYNLTKPKNCLCENIQFCTVLDKCKKEC